MAEQRVPYKSEIVDYYSRADILKEMMKFSVGREFCGAYKEGTYHKRPNVVQFPSDIIQMAKNNITSFHCSVERWNNPMQLSALDKNYSKLRSGFDFLMDIDSKLGETAEERIRSSQLCSSIICKFLRGYGIKSYGVKFSGSRGFHIIIPWEAFPQEVDYRKLKDDYPRIPQILASFIRDQLRDKVLGALVSKYGNKNLISISGSENPDPYSLVEVEKGWGERHLFRAPYSLNEKTWFVSLPLKDPSDYSPDIVKMKAARVSVPFLKECNENEAKALLRDALNWNAKLESGKKAPVTKARNFETSMKIPEEYFPPCIKLILNGLADGRKRSIFTLINFLRSMNWTRDEIETRIIAWNSKNSKPLPTSIVLGQLNYASHKSRSPPANCDNELYYKSIGICKPDEACRKIKNPISYPFKKPGANLSIRKKGRFACRECNKPFPDQKSLVMHQKRYHGEGIE